MTESKVNITVPADYSGQPIIVHLLEGSSPKQVNEKSFEITGNIYAPSDFLVGQNIDTKKTVLIFDGEQKSITASMNIGNDLYSTVQGKLSYSDVIIEFGINRDKRFSLAEFRNLVRLNGPWFNNQDAHANLLVKISDFSAKINAEFNNQKDTRGNSNVAVKKSVTSDVPFSFSLKAPVFKGDQNAIFNVDVCLEATDSGVFFWLESTDLIKLEHDIVGGIFQELRTKLSDLKYTILTKS